MAPFSNRDLRERPSLIRQRSVEHGAQAQNQGSSQLGGARQQLRRAAVSMRVNTAGTSRGSSAGAPKRKPETELGGEDGQQISGLVNLGLDGCSAKQLEALMGTSSHLWANTAS